MNKTQFNQNYNVFITALANSTGTYNPNAITINSITFGSVIINGAFAPSAQSGTSAANSQFQSFQSALSTNSSIGGMSILSSSVQVAGGTIIVDSSSSSIGIILGVCIPVAVISNFYYYMIF